VKERRPRNEFSSGLLDRHSPGRKIDPQPIIAQQARANLDCFAVVPTCPSTSHIAFGSIRMEPVFMVLGQSAATAGVMALESQSSVQDVEIKRLQQRFVADGQVLTWK
jgi:hypothetical protein